MINTQRNYNYNRKLISDKTNKNIMDIEKIFIILLPIILLIGVVDYYYYKKKEIGKNFNDFTFFFGKLACKKKKYKFTRKT